MASLLRRLLRHQSPINLTTSLRNRRTSLYQTLAPPIPIHHSQSIDSRLSSLLPRPPTKEIEAEKREVKCGCVYPSFSYGVVVNPVFEIGEEEGKMMWADSTKKKRKKKMNKHKYKKLRKLMRNK